MWVLPPLFSCRDLSHLTTLWSELKKTSMKFDTRCVPWDDNAYGCMLLWHYLHTCSMCVPPLACRMSEEVVRVFLTLGELTSNRWGVPTATKARLLC